MLRIVFIVDDAESATASLRVLRHVDLFERDGIDLYPMLLPRPLRSRRKMFDDLASFDAAVLQRCLIQPWEFRMLRKRVRVLGCDLDEALLYADRGPCALFSPWRQVKFRTIVRGVDFITAGNSYLVSLCGKRENVYLVPTPIDTGKYAPAADRAGGPIRIGCISYTSALRHLDEILPAVEKVAAVRPGVTLTVVAGEPPRPRPFIHFVPWRRDSEAAEVAAFDVGIMPLPDNRRTRGECGFELLLYGACGLPSVASPVGAGKEIIVDGRTGLFASSGAEWEQALTRLIDDAGLRGRLGHAARARVDSEYSTRVVIPKWAEVLKEMASR